MIIDVFILMTRRAFERHLKRLHADDSDICWHQSGLAICASAAIGPFTRHGPDRRPGAGRMLWGGRATRGNGEADPSRWRHARHADRSGRRKELQLEGSMKNGV